MRNLRLLSAVRVADATELQGTHLMCLDYDTGTVYCATAEDIIGLKLSSHEVTSHVSLVDHGYMPTDGSGRLVGLEYLPDQTSVCLASVIGNLALWNTLTGEVECVGSVEQGLMAMCWSADQELLVLATGQDTLIMMTREFEPITEVSMFSEEVEAQFVNVGWGKKETQFHGSAGKQAAVKQKETVSAACDGDDKKTRICWHGDGQFFAVSAVHPTSGTRDIRVWTRDCTLHSIAESVIGLEHSLGWKSTGNLITSCQRKPNGYEMIFLEKNGLRHGEFSLPSEKQQVKEVVWNCDSTILAVWLEDLPSTDSEARCCSVQLWSVSNYHWYQKQTLTFPASDAVAALCWDQEKPLTLHIVCQGGQYLSYTWGWATFCSGSAGGSTVAVIDGDKVLMTPFQQMVVPPPLSAYQLHLTSAVNQVAFSTPSDSAPTELAVITTDNQVAIFTFGEVCFEEAATSPVSSAPCVKVTSAGGNGYSVKCHLPTLHGQYRLSGDLPAADYPLQFSHLSWLTSDQLLAATSNMMGTETDLYRLTVNHQDRTVLLSRCCELPGLLYNTAMYSGCVALQLTDGQVLKYSPDTDTAVPWTTASGDAVMYSPPKLCSQMAVTTLGGEVVVLGLTDWYHFYVNNVEVAVNCTAFTVHSEFLLLTTFAHTCRCISRTVLPKALVALSDGKAHPYDESVRRVERGSRIVSGIPDSTKLILQMPRGNLEAIHPRALVLSAIRKHLDSIQYNEAFIMMRRHRINMNLLYDHNPAVFLNNIAVFIKQNENPTFISHFLSDIQEEDVSQTMYTASYDRHDNQASVAMETIEKPSKINIICDRMREALIKTDFNKYLLSILTAFVKKSPPQLDRALNMVKDLTGQQKNGPITAEEALKHLVFLVDVNELYDVALGTYDFDLVLLVAEKSQKDPKEYIPFLNSLRQMETLYQHYTIDKHLKNFTSALENIAKCEEHFEECLSLIREQKLYREAVKLFKPGSAQHTEVALAYSEFLRDKGHNEEAGLVLATAGQWAAAIKAFEASLNWRMAICAGLRAELGPGEIQDLYLRLAVSLKEHNQHLESACVYQQHLNDVEEAIAVLIEGSHWEEALRLMHQSLRLDFVETHLTAALLESCSQHLTLIRSTTADFRRYTARLAVVRQQKRQASLDLLEGVGGDQNLADRDLYSDTSSATGESVLSTTESQRSSIFSKRSGRSAKTRRKQERKKWSLKEGSPYEDVALVEVLWKLCKQTEEWKGDISALLRMLILFHHQEAAQELQAEFEGLLLLIQKAAEEIWPDEEAGGQTHSMPVLGPDSTANTIALSIQRGRPLTTDIKIDPALRYPPTLGKDSKWKLHSSSIPGASS